MATERINLWKNIRKSEAIRGMKLKLCRNVLNISLYKMFFCFFYCRCSMLSLLWFPLTYNEKSESRSLLLSHCRYMYFVFWQCFYKCLLSSKKVVQFLKFDLLPWQLKVQNVELSFYSCSVRWALWPIGLWFVLFSAVNTDTKLTLHHMGEFFIIFPADSYQVILNKMNKKSKMNKKQTNTNN